MDTPTVENTASRTPKVRALLSWSTGKDAAWSLHQLRQAGEVDVVALLTTTNRAFERVAMHAVRQALLERQAEAVGLPLITVPLPWPCTNAQYEEALGTALVDAIAQFDVTHIAFGDLYLEEVRAYRERLLEPIGLQPLFPLWGKPTDALAQEMIAGGLEAYLTCVDPRRLPASFAGRMFDASLLAELPPDVDLCGEGGEFHTCVVAGPMFSAPIATEVGEVVERDGFVFADLLAVEPRKHSMRIVSLLPSATEIVCALGLEENLVGVTHECDYPPFVKSLPKVTQTLIPHDAASADIDGLVRERLKTSLALYSLNMPVLETLRPNLLVTQALCDVCAVAEAEVSAAACTLPGLPKVVNLEPMSLEDVFSTLHLLGKATDTEARAVEVVEALRRRVHAVEERTQQIPPADRPKVAFVEWIDPIFNGGHWNPTLVDMAGGIDVLGMVGQASRTTPWETVVAAQPDVLFIACCGFSRERTLQDIPLLECRQGWGDLPCVRNGRVYVTDGNAYFSRPGPRLVDSLEIMAHALHPNVHPLPDGLPSAQCLPLKPV